MSYELFQQGPAVYVPIILLSLIITLGAYCAFPLIFAKFRKKIITKKKYRVLCYCVNLAVMALFIVKNGASSGGPYILWTWVFSAAGIKILESKSILEKYHCQGEASVATHSMGDNYVAANSETPESVIAIVDDSSTPKEHPQIKFCWKCGFELIEGSEFCSNCGTKIKKETNV